ncbi:MAG TPA: UDP-N-acetylglucosamine diphosphorylase/glucosamine-1-phosphate N-acetyltransferase [Aeromonadales bacterium]|nr:UDP-N-acetylglucosamine diphosphorylase/glucosamine-1-phosphate N-acetyltransferase [Aeromonadales bacterium]
MDKVSVIILAAGQGTRMHSSLPKVLHPIAGKPMLHHVIEAADKLKPIAIHIVFGHGGDEVKKASSEYKVQWHLQQQQLGTGHAVNQAMPNIADEETVLILFGDVPLIQVETIRNLLTKVAFKQMALLTVVLDDPTGYGRIVRNEKNEVQSIVEQKDANEAQRRIQEVNTGILAAQAGDLKRWLNNLDNNNAQGEYYLTDIIEMAVKDGYKVATSQAVDALEVEGVNNRLQQAKLERHYQKKQADVLMLQGVTLLDPTRIDVRGDITVGKDVVIDVGVILEGDVKLGDGVYVGPNTLIKNSEIAEYSRISANCVIEAAMVESFVSIGPFARLRPGTVLKQQVHVGNFVEIKNSTLEQGSKAGHLSYLGDAEIGKRVNIGAGTITCNYDGANKHKTVLEDDVFVGSDTQLVAPVKVSKGVTIGAGTTVTSNVTADSLVISRVKQKEIHGWQRPQKSKKNQEK